MRRVAALLAAVLAGFALTGCEDGAEPGAPEGATLVLDFTPNAVHAGLYAAQARGYFEDEGMALEIREPSSTADGAKLLETGRADFAVMDINDFGIARRRGLAIVALAAIVQRPLASVIAADGDAVRTPADLRGRTVGVTGVPSDDAVLDTVLGEGGLGPGDVERQTIGFESVRLLASAKVDAATAFWNAEGVELKRAGIATREFRVDEFGAPRYPELVVAAPERGQRPQKCALLEGLRRGYELLRDQPSGALDDLLERAPALDPDAQRAQLDALVASDAFVPGPELDEAATRAWQEWAVQRGILTGKVGGLPARIDC